MSFHLDLNDSQKGVKLFVNENKKFSILKKKFVLNEQKYNNTVVIVRCLEFSKSFHLLTSILKL